MDTPEQRQSEVTPKEQVGWVPWTWLEMCFNGQLTGRDPTPQMKSRIPLVRERVQKKSYAVAADFTTLPVLAGLHVTLHHQTCGWIT